jgi:acyl carrier protein phosphodiesterase
MQELMANPPEGFRKLSPEEKLRFVDISYRLIIQKERLRSTRLEEKKAALEMERAKSQIAPLAESIQKIEKESAELEQEFGVAAPGDLIQQGREFYIKEEKKPEVKAEPPVAGVEPKKEEAAAL